MIEYNDLDFADRKPIWIALSEFYLDTKLQETTIDEIAEVINNSPYTYNDIREIDKYELFPVLVYNLFKSYGDWAGFEEKWLIEKILKTIQGRNSINRFVVEILYVILQKMNENYWMRLKERIKN